MVLYVSHSSRIFLWSCSPISSITCLSVCLCSRPSGDVMEPQAAPATPGWPFPLVPQDWEHTPTAIQASGHTLQDDLPQLRERVAALAVRLQAHSTTSPRPPSVSPSKKPRQHTRTTPRCTAGRKPGHLGHRPVLVLPTTVQELRP